MAKIQTYQGREQLPASVSHRIGNPMGQAFRDIANLSDGALKALGQHKTKKRNLLIADDANALDSTYREMYRDTKLNRRGKNAIETPEGPGVYQDFQTFSDEKVASFLQKYPEEDQEAAKNRFHSITRNYSNMFLGHEASQYAAVRKDVIDTKTVNESNLIVEDVGDGAGVERIMRGLADIELTTTENSGGADNKIELMNVRNDVAKRSVLTAADGDFQRGEVLLKNKEIASMLTPEDKSALKRVIEGKRVEQTANALYSSYQGFDYARQLEAGQKIKDQAVQKEYLKIAKTKHNELEEIESEYRADTYSGAWDLAIKKPPEIKRDDVLKLPYVTEKQREHLLSMIESPGGGPRVDPLADIRKEEELYEGFYLGTHNLSDARTAMNNSEIKPTTYRRLKSSWTDKEKSPDLDRALGMFRDKYADALEEPEDWEEFQRKMISAVMEARVQKAGKELGIKELQEIGDNLMEPKTVDRFYAPFVRGIGRTLPGLSPFVGAAESAGLLETEKPFYGTDTTDTVYGTDTTFTRVVLDDLRKSYPEARYDYKRNVYVLERLSDTQAIVYDPAAKGEPYKKMTLIGGNK